MTDKTDGGPAFPFGQVSEASGQPINGYHNDGMSLRVWLAGQALAGWGDTHNIFAKQAGDGEWGVEEMALTCLAIADQVIKHQDTYE